MVLEVDLTKEEQSKEVKQPSDTQASSLSPQVPKRSVFKRLKDKMKVWQANFAKMPLSHKVILLSISIAVASLISIAVVYGFVIFTVPGHNPIDTTYKLLSAQSFDSSEENFELPEPPKVKDKENPVNGELYTTEEYEELSKNKPLVVMIENHTDARPQSGLTSANIVYETLAESGITRFMAVFWGKEASEVGPIRSIRTYFLDWASEYDDPPVCNIGQAGYDEGEAVIVPEADARSYMYKYNIKSYDRYGRKVTWRDYDKYNSGIAWEHVAYSSTKTLWDDAQAMGWVGPANVESLNFKKDESKDKRPLSQEIEIKFLSLSTSSFQVKWVYDKDSNTYKRFLAGEEHIDENNNKQISAKNVIIQHCKYSPTGDKNGRLVFTTIDEGKADIILDGKIINGTWKKASRTDRTKFYDESGNEVELNRGQIWIEVVPMSGNTDLSTITIR